MKVQYSYESATATALPRRIHRDRRCFKPFASHCGSSTRPVRATEQPYATRRHVLQLLPSVVLALTYQSKPAYAEGPRPSDVEQAVAGALRKVAPKAKAPVLLRLVFHDAGTYSLLAQDGGVNGSIQYELDRPESFGLKKGWNVIKDLRKALKGTAAEGLSDGDLVAAAGAYAVAICGGPQINVPLGRPQATGPDPNGRMLSENASSEDQKTYFTSMGLTLKEAVALLGAHTLGNKGYGDSLTFDNTYYVELLKKPWTNTKDSMASMIGIPSDHVLADDQELLPYIREYAANQSAFFDNFAAAYMKMTSLGAKLA